MGKIVVGSDNVVICDELDKFFDIKGLGDVSSFRRWLDYHTSKVWQLIDSVGEDWEIDVVKFFEGDEEFWLRSGN